MPHRFFNAFLCVAASTLLASCGGASGGGANPIAPTARAALSATMSATGQRTATGYRYEITFRLNETAGVGARVSSVDLDFFVGNAPDGSTHFDNPLSNTDRVGGNETASSKLLGVTDDRPNAPFDTRVEARIAYTDDTQM